MSWHFLRLEWRGHSKSKKLRNAGLGVLAKGSKPWVARIDGECHKYGLSRSFVDEYMDSTGANKTGDRGIFLFFAVNEGELYECGYYRTSTKYSRYFFFHDGDCFVEIDKREAFRWAKSM